MYICTYLFPGEKKEGKTYLCINTVSQSIAFKAHSISLKSHTKP